jgi:hypothetical protein
MIHFVVARYDNDSFDGFLSNHINDFSNAQMFNEDENDSIFRKYNRGVDSLRDKISDDDVVCFCHADVRILDQHFEEKIKMYFSIFTDVGLAGVIGTTRLDEHGGWWQTPHQFHRGHVMQWVSDKESEKYHMIKKICNATDLVALDGLIMFARGSVAKTIPFDEAMYPNSYDFYDIDYSVTVRDAGYSIGVVDVKTEHKSAGTGALGNSWSINRERFVNKWKTKGYTFPIVGRKS